MNKNSHHLTQTVRITIFKPTANGQTRIFKIFQEGILNIEQGMSNVEGKYIL